MLKNPFLVYIAAFGTVLAAYQLGWSEIYPKISLDLVAFFGLTFAVCASLALAISDDIADTGDYRPGLLPDYTALLFIACCGADIAYSGSVPLLELINGSFIYGSFTGAPTLNVFVVTFATAFSAIRFADSLYAKSSLSKVRYMIEALLPIAFFLIVVYRGAAIISATSWAFIYIIKRGRLGFVRFAAITVLGLGVLYLNGVIGDARSAGQAEKLGFPTQGFRDLGIPAPTFGPISTRPRRWQTFNWRLKTTTHHYAPALPSLSPAKCFPISFPTVSFQ